MITLDDGTDPPGPSQPGFLSPAGRRSADVLTWRFPGRSPPKSALDVAGVDALRLDPRVAWEERAGALRPEVEPLRSPGARVGSHRALGRQRRLWFQPRTTTRGWGGRM